MHFYTTSLQLSTNLSSTLYILQTEAKVNGILKVSLDMYSLKSGNLWMETADNVLQM